MSEWGTKTGAGPGSRGRTKTLALVLLVWIALVPGCGGSDNPDYDFLPLDAAMQPLREDFEAGYGTVRVVAVLAPTCGNCLRNGELIYEELDWFEQNGVEVMFVWGAPMATDNHMRCQEAIDRYPSDYIAHYYDDTGKTTRSFGRMLGAEGAQNIYDVVFVYGKEATWDPNNTMESEPDDFSVAKAFWAPSVPDVLFSGNPTRIALTMFTIEKLKESVQPLL